MNLQFFVAFFLIGFLGLVPIWHNALGASVKDTESASHGDEAASYQIVKIYDYPGLPPGAIQPRGIVTFFLHDHQW